MAKAAKKDPKKRANKYEEKVSFTGTLDDLIKISTTGAGVKKKEPKKKD